MVEQGKSDAETKKLSASKNNKYLPVFKIFPADSR